MKILTILMAVALIILILCDTTTLPIQKTPIKIQISPSGVVSIYIDGHKPIFF